MQLLDCDPSFQLRDDMPLNAIDKAWVQQQIAASHTRIGIGKLTGAIKDWGGTGAAVAIIIFVIAQWGNYTEFRTHTGDRLDGIEKRLDRIDVGILELRASQSPDTVLHEINGMTQTKFPTALSALHAAVQKPIAGNTASQPLLGGIAQKLLKTNTLTPDYWPTVLQFLQFASAGLASAHIPTGAPVSRSSKGLGFGTLFKGVVVLLDGGTVTGARFEDCRVIFADHPTRLINVTFVNSVFEFPVSSAPSPYIQQAGKLLLASDLKSVSLNLPSTQS